MTIATRPYPSVGRERSNRANTVGDYPAVIQGLKINEAGLGGFRQTEFEFTDLTISIADGGGSGYGSLQIYNFPTCGMLHLGTTGRVSGSRASSTGGAVEVGLGIEAVAEYPLADLSIIFAQNFTVIQSGATSGTGSFVLQSAAAQSYDNSLAALPLYLNASYSGDPVGAQSLTLNGWLLVTWLNLGDPNLS